MCRPQNSLLVAASFLLMGQNLLAVDLKITLQARAGGHEQSARSGQQAMPTLAAKRGDVFFAHWVVTNLAGSVSGITLHAFMDREGVTKPGAGALYETALVLDFQPGEQSKGEFRMPLRDPGTYVLRVEAVEASARPGPFAALRVTVP